MNLDAYHKAWMQGFSEKECCRIAEDKYEQDMLDRIEEERLYKQYEEAYYAELDNELLEGEI